MGYFQSVDVQSRGVSTMTLLQESQPSSPMKVLTPEPPQASFATRMSKEKETDRQKEREPQASFKTRMSREREINNNTAKR